MKIVIVSDIHANLAALRALPERDYDELWCIGDLVDYGPKPHEVVQWIKRHATVAVRGNHDHAAGFSVDPQCSPAFKKLADETLQYTLKACTREDLSYLRNLPIQREIIVASTKSYLVHAMPTDPLFGYCPEESEQWMEQVDWISADMLVVGHTHTQFLKRAGLTTILNPGSVGQPKTGRPLACCAIWEDGKISRKEYEYPVAETIQDIRGMPISTESQDALIVLLETGGTRFSRS